MEITTTTELKKAIERLKIKNEEQKLLIRHDFNTAIESLTPSGLLKSAAKNIAANPDIATSAVGTTLAVGAGVLSKKIIPNPSRTSVSEFAHYPFPYPATLETALHSKEIRLSGKSLYGTL